MATMHPSRQAYVEEAEPEVRRTQPLCTFFPNYASREVHTTLFRSRESGQARAVAVRITDGKEEADGNVCDSRIQKWGFPLTRSVSLAMATKTRPPRSLRIAIDHDYNIQTAAGEPSEKASAVLAQFARKRFAATIAVPTDDKRVRVRLRELGEPITLFGEGPPERRDRLRELLTQQAEAGDEGSDMQME